MWMNLRNVVLSERSQSQRMTYFMIPVYMKYPEKENVERQKVD